jgi:NAD(P) transhydrogenase subunit alpha
MARPELRCRQKRGAGSGHYLWSIARMNVGIPKEIAPRERRVSATPETVGKLRKRDLNILVESGAGAESGYSDDAYIAAGAQIVATADALYRDSDIVLKVRAPEAAEIDALKAGAVLIGFIWPAQNKALLEHLATRQATVFAMDAVPRISRAQRMDALSAMANIAGYRAVLEAANQFDRFMPGQITAAGRAKPAQVLVLGAGVAGLAAIAAARGLGAVVKAFDTRSAVREQVESLGATFVEFDFKEEGEGQGGYAKEMSAAYLAAEQALIASHAKQSNIVISTALIPGKPAPQLLTAEAVTRMQPGSVIVDMAAEQGGNCPLTERDLVVRKHGVTLIGYTDLPSRMARQSSDLYAMTIFNFTDSLFDKQNVFRIDPDDEVHIGANVLRQGALTWPPPPRPKAAVPTSVAPSAAAGQALPSSGTSQGGHGARPGKQAGKKLGMGAQFVLLLLIALFGIAGIEGPPEFLEHLTVFLLACVVGYHVVWNVTPALHTPLMSVTNAISGIILVGGMVVLGAGAGVLADVLAAVAILLATINVVGGFLVTQRMLRMFRR